MHAWPLTPCCSGCSVASCVSASARWRLPAPKRGGAASSSQREKDRLLSSPAVAGTGPDRLSWPLPRTRRRQQGQSQHPRVLLPGATQPSLLPLGPVGRWIPALGWQALTPLPFARLNRGLASNNQGPPARDHSQGQQSLLDRISRSACPRIFLNQMMSDNLRRVSRVGAVRGLKAERPIRSVQPRFFALDRLRSFDQLCSEWGRIAKRGRCTGATSQTICSKAVRKIFETEGRTNQEALVCLRMVSFSCSWPTGHQAEIGGSTSKRASLRLGC